MSGSDPAPPHVVAVSNPTRMTDTPTGKFLRWGFAAEWSEGGWEGYALWFDHVARVYRFAVSPTVFNAFRADSAHTFWKTKTPVAGKVTRMTAALLAEYLPEEEKARATIRAMQEVR